MTHIIVGTQPNCQPCRLTKRKLSSMGIAFAEVDLTSSDELAPVIDAHGYTQAPIVLNTSTGESWSGYRPDRLAAL